MRKPLLFTFAFLLFTSLLQAGKYQIIDEYDEYRQVRRVMMVGNEINAVQAEFRSQKGKGSFNLQRFDLPDTTFYSLSVSYLAKRFLFIPAGSQLIFLVDGERIILEMKTKPLRDTLPLGIMETMSFAITREQVEQITAGEKVSCQLYMPEFEWKEKHLKRWREFVKKYWSDA